MIRPILQTIGDNLTIFERSASWFDEKWDEYRSGETDWDYDHFDEEWFKKDDIHDWELETRSSCSRSAVMGKIPSYLYWKRYY